MEGGLKIRDVATQNLAMGGKIIWNMITGKRTWSKQILWKNIFHRRQGEMSWEAHKSAERILDLLSLQKSPSLLHFKTHVDSGKWGKIRIWEDSILGDQPLNWLNEPGNIKAWLLSKNCSTLWDISSWNNDDKESWESWNLGDYPDELKEEASTLLEFLQEKSPFSARSKDKRI